MKCKVNSHLLPIKTHYFLFWGGLSGSMPYLLLIGQSLGISATAAAFLTSVFPLVPLIAKPIFGSLADYFKNIKVIVIGTLISLNISLLSLTFIPSTSRTTELPYGVLLCSHLGYEIGVPLDMITACSSNVTSKSGLNISANCYGCVKPEHYDAEDYSNISSNDLNCSGDAIQTFLLFDPVYSRSHKNFWFPVNDVTVTNNVKFCDDVQFYSCELNTGFVSSNSCEHSSSWDLYSTHQFWIFILLFVCSRTAMSILISLSDTVCFEMLEGRFDLYGNQRMWGAIGWGAFSLLCGYLLTLTPHDDFTPGLFMTISLLLIDALAISRAKVEISPRSGRILKDLGILLRNTRVWIFLYNVMCMGFLTGVVWNYFFWFLFAFGAPKVLLSLILVVQCFLGELPSFFFAGRLIFKIGFENAFTISFVTFGIRFMAYSFIRNPWLVLPVELCQGLTFGLFYSAMAMYAKSVSLPGTEGSMQGLVGGTFEGLGVALGGLVAGVTFDLVGGHMMFRYASIVAFCCAAMHVLTHLLFKKYLTEQHQDQRPVNDNEEEQNL